MGIKATIVEFLIIAVAWVVAYMSSGYEAASHTGLIIIAVSAWMESRHNRDRIQRINNRKPHEL